MASGIANSGPEAFPASGRAQNRASAASYRH